MTTAGARVPTTVWMAGALGVLNGGWMIFDGAHAIVRGDFIRIEGQLGPWAPLIQKVGVAPLNMRYPFVLLGILWLAACGGLIARKKWGWQLALAMSVISLLYLFMGTVVAAITFLLLLSRPTRQYISARRSNGSAG